ncbi:MAG: hypothetical protein K940chlam2_00048 [Chlamydiae bacterium]|nr:hypothetical protein [Chlamydiota bacterium]
METPVTDIATLIGDIDNGLEYIRESINRADYLSALEEIDQIKSLMEITNLPAVRGISLSLRPTPAVAHFNTRRQQIESLMTDDRGGNK